MLNKKVFDKNVKKIIENNSRHFIGYTSQGFVEFKKKILPNFFLLQLKKYKKSVNEYFNEIASSKMIMLYFINEKFGRVNVRYICYKIIKDKDNKISINYTIVK